MVVDALGDLVTVRFAYLLEAGHVAIQPVALGQAVTCCGLVIDTNVVVLSDYLSPCVYARSAQSRPVGGLGDGGCGCGGLVVAAVAATAAGENGEQ
ncbi:hypothetical protein [Streptomyces luteogriseus]|uniref:hypothetical protein n=1 Tax=Streptomyces luteogriseus TaxID=68233 RepID=UPI0037A2784A